MSVREKVAVELVTIAVLTTVFLLAFPKRSPMVDVGLAGFALLCLALSTSYTKKVIWAASPLPVAESGLSVAGPGIAGSGGQVLSRGAPRARRGKSHE